MVGLTPATSRAPRILIVGPALGVGAAWVRGVNLVRIGAGTAAIAGILIGEGAYGLTRIADTTPGGYWAAQIAVGLAIVIAISVTRLRTPKLVALCALLTALVSVVFYVF